MKKYVFLLFLIISFCFNSIKAQEKNNTSEKSHKIEFYHVKKSDNLFQISNKYGLKVKDLKAVNPGLTDDLSIGQIIIIPVYLTLDKEDIQGKKYKVKAKETLFSLSRKFNVSIEELEQANPIIKEKGLMAGYEIVIPYQDSTIVDINETIPKEPIIIKDTTKNVREYKVKFLEKLEGISKRENVDLKEIYRYNPALKNKSVRWGDIIFLPKLDKKKEVEIEKDSGEYFIYHVNYFETLPDILRKFNITKEQFLDWNHNIELPLKLGQEIRILKEEKPIDVEKSSYDECMNRNTSPYAEYKIAVMIPFHLNETPTKDELWKDNNNVYASFNFIQYYEGMLLAIERLEQEGVNAKLYFYDVGKNKSDVTGILDNNMRTMDIIIGPIYNTTFQVVSDFAQQYGIKIVNPLSKRNSIIENNHGVYKIQPSTHSSLKGMLNYISKNYKDSVNVYLVRNNKMKFTDEVNYFKENYKEIEGNQIKDIYTVNYSSDTLRPILDNGSSATYNVVIGLFEEKINTIEFIRHLNQFHQSIPNVTLMGLSEWSHFDMDNTILQNLNTYIFDNKYVDYTSDETKWFVNSFRERYYTEPQENKFAFVGYDVLIYFVKAMQKFGYDFEDCIEYFQYSGLQNDISLKKLKNGSFENQSVSPLWYNNYEIKKVRTDNY